MMRNLNTPILCYLESSFADVSFSSSQLDIMMIMDSEFKTVDDIKNLIINHVAGNLYD